ncbi:ATP-binding protein [Streptomyces decoyicus]|uniref:ATP-binding protein n=1 Tax=Streptomyces decoyicus TaxID=249567 RepID=UPI0038662861
MRPAADNQGTRLTVADDGPCVPEQVRREVFGRFVRGDHSRSRAAGGNGLGLAIVEAVVTAHGGQIMMNSRPGHTQFTVHFPPASCDSEDR